MNDDPVNELAERIAARGQDALVERLREAFAQAAAAHADIIRIDDAELEEIVQGYAPRADGLQWRRALATVASEELGIDVSQALHHPAVARAQELVGAPSYDESLAALINRPVPETPDAALEEARNGGYEEPVEDVDAVATESYLAGELEPAVEPQDENAEDAERASHSDPSALDPAGVEPWSPPVVESAPVVETEDGAADEADAFAMVEPETEATIESPEQTAAESEEPADAPDAAWQPLTEEPAAEAEHETFVMPPAGTFAGAGVEQADRAGDEESDDEDAASEDESSGARSYVQLPQYDPDAEEDRLRVTAVHLGGVANLTGSNQTVDLRLSDAGLDIMRDEEEIIGRLGWSDIEALEVPNARGLRRRRGMARAQLVVRTPSGDASFEIPAFTSEELRLRIEPLVDRFGRH